MTDWPPPGMLTILEGDVIEQLGAFPDESVHCCVTSPPYWGLRDYGTGTWEGGSKECDHKPDKDIEASCFAASTLGGGRDSQRNSESSRSQYRSVCPKCGARRIDRQIGLEPTAEAYVAKMVEVFREVRRVLRIDGVCWINLGSSYASSGKGGGGSFEEDGMTISAGIYAGGKRPTRFRSGVPSCGTDDKGQLSSPTNDRACSDSGGEHPTVESNRKSHNDPLPDEAVSSLGTKVHDKEQEDSASSSLPASPPFVQASTIPSSSLNAPDASRLSTMNTHDLEEVGTSSRCAQESGGSSACTSGTHPPRTTSDLRTSDKEPYALTCLYSTIASMKFKPKDMIPTPWLVALALQSDGWFLRQDIIWHKPNPMPESVTDRCTKSPEFIFLLTKSARYFFDAEAVKERAETEPHNSGYVNGKEYAVGPMDRGGHSQREDPERVWAQHGTRNRRSVWTVPSFAYPGAHFATYPPDLIKPCILAGTSARGCCPKCGAPWEKVVEASPEYQAFMDSERIRKGDRSMRDGLPGAPGVTRGTGNKSVSAEKQTLGWKPTCKCGCANTIPCTVLDPFAGSFTTCAVSMELGRNAIGIELNPEYVKLGKERCAITPGLMLA